MEFEPEPEPALALEAWRGGTGGEEREPEAGLSRVHAMRAVHVGSAHQEKGFGLDSSPKKAHRGPAQRVREHIQMQW
jgi:hypothetical protein